jgi:hypothetical protein
MPMATEPSSKPWFGLCVPGTWDGEEFGRLTRGGACAREWENGGGLRCRYRDLQL